MTKLRSKMRVLLVNRPDNFKIRGGDTMHINRLKKGLEKFGVHVDISTSLDVNPTGYDIINIFNLLIPSISVNQLSSLRMQTRAPIIMTPFYWDMSENIWADSVIPLAVEKAANDAELETYLSQIDQGILNAGYLTRHGKNLPNLEFEEQQKLSLEFVDHLISISDAEDKIIRKNLPCNDIPSTTVYTGMDLEIEESDPALFIEEYGVKDFVLVTGRVEGRKNQLMLLLAMRGTGIPVVVVGAQPDKKYLELCKKIAPEGTIFTGRISYELLKSARAAAKVHCLPSWWECAGIVHLEAGLAGCAVVAGKQAAEEEYLADHAYYCNPGSAVSIRKAILAAYNNYDKDKVKREKFKDFLRDNFSWDLVAKRTLEVYKEAMARNNSSTAGSYENRRYKREFAQGLYHAVRNDPAGAMLQFNKNIDAISTKPIYKRIFAQQVLTLGKISEGLKTLKDASDSEPENGVYKLNLAEAFTKYGQPKKAIELLQSIVLDQSNFAVVNLLLAEIFLSQKQTDEALIVLEKLAENQPKNARVKALLASCYDLEGNSMEAEALFKEASGISSRAYQLEQMKKRPGPEEVFKKIIKSDNPEKIIDESFDDLSKGLINLFIQSALSENLKGNRELSAYFVGLAEKIGERIGIEISPLSTIPTAEERFSALMATEDILTALDTHFDWIDEDLLTYVRKQAQKSRKDENNQIASAMDNLAEYIEQAIKVKDQFPEGAQEESTEKIDPNENYLDMILSSSDPVETIISIRNDLDESFLAYLKTQIELLRANDENEAAKALTTIAEILRSTGTSDEQQSEPDPQESLNLLLNSDDLPTALQENEHLLTHSLLTLVEDLSSKAIDEGENDLAEGYSNLADYIRAYLGS